MKDKRVFIIFYLLAVYVTLQFAWWAYLLVDLNEEVHREEARIAREKGETTKADRVLKEADRRFWMVMGEGSVFLILLGFGFYKVHNAFRKELALARQEKNFLMAITHELKTPLSSVKLYLETLQKRELAPNEQKKVAGHAIRETDRLNGLIENVLLTTRIESGHFRLEKHPQDLGRLIRETLERPAETIGRQHHTEFDLAEGIEAPVDPGAFASILTNLYENATKYAPEQSRIRVALRTENSRATILISDEGPGMDPAELERITERFYRADREETRQKRGTGLGLYIVKELVDRHKGEFWVERNEAGGSTFYVSLSTEY